MDHRQRLRWRRPALCLLASALAHVGAVLLTKLLLPADLERTVFRPVTLPFRRFPIERFQPQPARPVSRQLLERVRALGPSTPTLDGHDEAAPAPLATIEPPALPVAAWADTQGHPGWQIERDTLADSVRRQLQHPDLPDVDPVELDAERRRRSVGVFDPDTGKLRWGWLHLWMYSNGGEGVESNRSLARGLGLPRPVPLEITIHWLKPGLPALPMPGIGDEPDPLHGYGGYPQRHILHRSEIREQPFIDLRYVDVESLEVVADYLASGGFALMEAGQLSLCRDALTRRHGDRVESLRLELGHPVFHAFFDIDHYSPANRFCPAVRPLQALQLDGRIVAAVGVDYTPNHDCPANQFYANVLAYGLVQPGAMSMGGRYRAPSVGSSP